MQPLVSIRHVGKKFNAVHALDDVSFDVLPGELHAIMGENGAGKSTLMKILSGVIPDYSGELWIDGQPQRFSSTSDAERVGISIIHQELNLVEQLSVAANIFLGREITNRFGLLNSREMERQSAQLLSELKSHISPTALVSSLRVGDQQLIEIAKALALQSSILIMDEPTSALTESEVARLYGVIDAMRSRGVTILYISHKMDEVFRLADRITVLRDGKFVTTVDKSATDARQIAHLMVGRDLEQPAARQIPGESPVVLAVDHLSLPWPGHAQRWRLRDISFQLRRGEIVGIAGLMGAGRTELLECLFGASPLPHQGQIMLHGRPCRFAHPAQAMSAGIAMVTEDRKRLGLFSTMSVRENISVCALKSLSRRGVLLGQHERQAAQHQVVQLGVKADGVDASIHSLSGGNQQKCIVGRCLLTNPQVLLLDDPTRGVDVGAKAELYRLMERLAAEGMAILVTSSELPELLTVSDRILVMCEGVLTGEFSRAAATEQKIMEAATQSTPRQTA